MTHRVFIDGQAGTTGLELVSWLSGRDDVTLMHIDEPHRKNEDHRRERYAAADVVVLCLPDDAAARAAELHANVRFLDASTAHRTHPRWTYGLPELQPGQRKAIAASSRVSNPGCYPTGFILAVKPLIDAGVMAADLPLRVHAVSGYSGGGRAMISTYKNRRTPTMGFRPYALGLEHKHVPEMQAWSGTRTRPLFAPSVGHYYRGMLVQVGLFTSELAPGSTPETVAATLAARYSAEPFVHVHENADATLIDGFMSATERNCTNHLDLMVFGNAEQVMIVSRYDNLGKGAAGAAAQNLNLMLGLPETTGLERECIATPLDAMQGVK